ncbi:MAG: FAD-binding oxidoreductase, partial [Myxococcota bacterium]
LPLAPYRRHLALLRGVAPPPDAPLVYSLDDVSYARPEEGGLLASPCDEDAGPPGAPAVDDRALALLCEKLACYLPAAASARVAKAWACQRTFAPDRLPALGADPRVRGLHWCAGLGGSGVTVGLAAARRVADALLGGAPIEADLAAARLVS